MDVIKILRGITKIRKIGHAGTLDPLASGVLLVCIGPATKKIEGLVATKKEYVAEVDLSVFSETDDLEGELSLVDVKEKPTDDDIKKCLSKFIGNIKQSPPKYSAIKIKGKPAYKYARSGKEIELKTRDIVIDSIELLSYNWPKIIINIVCGKGTYIRSLARDIGTNLNTGGCLTGLERTRVGDYTIDESIDLERLRTEGLSLLEKHLIKF